MTAPVIDEHTIAEMAGVQVHHVECHRDCVQRCLENAYHINQNQISDPSETSAFIRTDQHIQGDLKNPHPRPGPLMA